MAVSIPFRLILPCSFYEAMCQHAQSIRPLECCGILAGTLDLPVARVVAHYPLTNALASPVEFEGDPRELLRAYRDIDARGLRLLAIYHSHPTSPPIPSKKDLERSYGEDVVNFILSLTSVPPTVRAWWLTGTDYREAEWELRSDGDAIRS